MKTLLLIPFLIASLCGQQKKAPPKLLRIIPLGEEPELKQLPVGPDGIIPLQAPPPGSVLPMPLALRTGEIQIPLQLALFNHTKPLAIPAEVKEFDLRKIKPDMPWLTRKAPSVPLSLGVLYRNSRTMSWNNPELLLLRDDATALPAGRIRFINTSNTMVLYRIGTRKQLTTYGVGPGKVSSKLLKPGGDQIWIGYKDATGKIVDYPLSIKVALEKDERAQFFFYKPQAKEPRKPFLIYKKIEKTPK
ncbi:MAG: hypothetical protein ACON4R_07745 [Akkermansiaceae bacterium]